jgi:branched-chain amino acid transport system substrate-binding protein
MPRKAAALLLAALAIAAGGCGGDGGEGDSDATLTVYVSAPFGGPRGAEGRELANGARLALADARGRAGRFRVRAAYLDDGGGRGWDPVRTAANARRAAEDSSAIGYLGELDSGATRISLPITNQAEIVQISPGSTAVDLTRIPAAGRLDPERLQPSDRRTFARIVPADDVQARAAALWAKRIGAGRVDFASDGSEFGDVLVQAFDAEAARLGLGSGEGAAIDALYYGGSPPGLAKALRTGAPPQLLASDALLDRAFLRSSGGLGPRLRITSSFRDPLALPAAGQRFLRAYGRRFGEPAGPAAAYGYEAMALLLDAIEGAGGRGSNRGAVIDEVLATSDRRSVVGTYSIDGNGDTTLEQISGYRVEGGKPVFTTELRP